MKFLRPTHPYIPMACGFLYLVAIIDWASRAVLAWRLSNTNDASFCAAALEEALLRFGKPRIFNSDQGSTFTAEAFTGKLVTAGVEISMDGLNPSWSYEWGPVQNEPRARHGRARAWRGRARVKPLRESDAPYYGLPQLGNAANPGILRYPSRSDTFASRITGNGGGSIET